MYASTRIGPRLTLRIRKHAMELAELAPDVILATGDSTVPALLQATHTTIPVVFPLASDPVGGGYIDSLARPGGNATGFMMYEYNIGGKWLELLKEIAPNIAQVAVLRDPASPTQTAQYGAIQTAAPSLRVEVIPVNMRDASEIERVIANSPLGKWQPDPHLKCCGLATSQLDHSADGLTQAAGDLLGPLLRQWRRLDFLWA